jgi:hypothetical protein
VVDPIAAAALYAGVALGHWAARRPVRAAARAAFPLGPAAPLWDLAFYVACALVVSSPAPVAAGGLVLTCVLVSALAGRLVAERAGAWLLMGWGVGAGAIVGTLVTTATDRDTAAAVVLAHGAVVAAVLAVRATAAAPARAAVTALGVVGVAVALAGALLIAFPRGDHGWLTALEARLPLLQTAFLTAGEREARADALRSAAQDEGENPRPAAAVPALRVGDPLSAPGRQEQVDQFRRARDVATAGDRFVVAHLRAQARARQRFVLGVPLAALGAGGVWWACRRWRHRAS